MILGNAVTSFTASGIWVKNFPDGEINSLTKLRLIAISVVPRPSKDKLPDVKAALDQGITELREIGRIVSFIYGLPNKATNTGNTRPLDPRAISHKATVIPTTTPGT